MRGLEILLLVLAVVVPFILNQKSIKENHKPITIALLGALIAHFVFESPRWQMAPIYLIFLLSIFLVGKKYVYFKGGWVMKSASGLLLVVVLALGFVFSSALPVFELPIPQGKYEVGAQYLHVVTGEEESITSEAGDKREFIVKAWYPAVVSEEQPEPYLDEAGRQGIAVKFGLPNFAFDYLDQIQTHTYQAPKPAEGTFPVLIFSHGYYANAFGYYALIEEIVSQGFIVLNINHTYESVGSKFPSGEIKLYNSEYGNRQYDPEMSAIIWKATEELKQATTIAEKKTAIDHLLKHYYAAEISDRWEKDIHEVINHLPDWSATSFLSNHMDTEKIGVFGHSQGGSAVGQAVLNNPKIAAGVNLDGVQWGAMVDTSIHKPFLLISSDWPAYHPNFNEVAYHNSQSPDFHAAMIANSGHSNFMDIPFMVNIPGLNEAGNIDPTRAIRITSNAVVQFFNKHLNGREADLLQLSEAHPELEIVNR